MSYITITTDVDVDIDDVLREMSKREKRDRIIAITKESFIEK